MGFKENEIYESKEYSIIKKIRKMFKSEIINEQYRVDKYFIDLVFPTDRLGMEIDENGHFDRAETKERKREKTIKEARLELTQTKKSLILMIKLVIYKYLLATQTKN